MSKHDRLIAAEQRIEELKLMEEDHEGLFLDIMTIMPQRNQRFLKPCQRTEASE